MLKRKHQIDFERVIDAIISGSPIRNIIVKATPGSGKSSLPIIAGKLITAGLADKICWICPRMSLQDQAERNFLDPFFRELFWSSAYTIRSSTNEVNPCRGTQGLVTTYQALGVDTARTVQEDFGKHRYILVLDEYHHAEECGEWTKALIPLYERAAFRVLMTGTLGRGDAKKIAFTPYREDGLPDLQGDERTAVIEYTRRDALADRAIIPLEFMFSDGSAKWEKRSGKVVESLLSTDDPRKASHALYTALHTEYATELLSESVAHWQKHRRRVSSAKLLVVSASIESAKEYTDFLKAKLGLSAAIATSEDGPEAVKAIKAFKASEFDILVTVAMGYEGMDVPSISHIACLTRIRSLPWIEQMVARAVRIDPQAGPYETQKGYIFAPHDLRFLEIVEKIHADQIQPAESREPGPGNGKGEAEEVERDLFGEPATPGGIKPLSSRMTERRELPIDQALAFTREVQTNREREDDLLSQIEKHIRAYSFQNRYNPKKINGEILRALGKPRREMTIRELEACLSHVRRTYPLSHVRGTGRRVPTKAQPYFCAWKEE